MSYYEYYDLYENCQTYAPYHLFTFDIVGSRNLFSQGDTLYISKISELIYNLYKKIEKMETTQNRQILHRSPFIIHPDLVIYENGLKYLSNPKEVGDYVISNNIKCLITPDHCEPFQTCGDTIGLTILRDTLTEDEVYSLFDQTKKELNITYDFHYANGYYETDLYAEGGTKLYRGYIIPMLSTQHKKENPIKKIKEQ